MSRDRYQPLPPVTQLPGLLWTKMGTGARALVALAALGAVVAIVLLAPRISDTKSENTARDRREAAAVTARLKRRVRELQRPRTATAGAADPVADLERLITADARSRPDAGRVLRTDCEALPDSGGRFSCTAVTSDLPGGNISRPGSVGFPFRALVKGRRLAWCRISGQPGEGANQGRPLVPIPRACGG